MIRLSYCDYIAHTIVRPALVKDNNNDSGVIKEVGQVKMDLEPKEGYMVSTAKRLDVVDFNGKQYRITIEEI